MATIQQLLSKSEELRTQLEERLESLNSDLDDIQENGETLKTEVPQNMGDFFDLATQQVDLLENEVQTLNEQLDATMDFTDSLIGSIEGLPDRVAEAVEKGRSLSLEASESLKNLQAESIEASEELIGDAQEQLTDSLNTNSGNAVELLEEARETSIERFEELRKSLSQWHEQTTETINQIMGVDLANQISEETKKFSEVLNALEKTGLDEVTKLTDAVGSIEDSAGQVLDLIESVEPVLELARTV